METPRIVWNSAACFERWGNRAAHRDKAREVFIGGTLSTHGADTGKKVAPLGEMG
jgi:hypothetical protein